jgi:hypothetical protein
MTGTQCPHCGQPHPAGTLFCPVTGRPFQAGPPQHPAPGYPQPPPGYPLQPPPGYPQQPPQGYPPPPGYPQPPPYGSGGPPGYGAPPGYGPPPAGYGPPGGYAPPQGPYGQPAPGYRFGVPVGGPVGANGAKPVGVILSEAFALYRKHLGTLLLTCAIVLVPVSLVKSTALALILAPTAAITVQADHAKALAEKTAERTQKMLAETDPAKREQLEVDQQKELEDLQRSVVTDGAVAMGGLFTAVIGALMALLGVAVMYGIAIPIVTGALTIVVANLVTAGNGGPTRAYGRLFRRFGKLATAETLGFLLVLIGLCLLVIPGLVLAFLFLFAGPVVLLENVGGFAALKRSVVLVKANVPQVAVVCLVFAAIRIAASIVSKVFIPTTAVFVDSVVEDALVMFMAPFPILGTVLLYLDIRRQTEGLDGPQIRAALDL